MRWLFIFMCLFLLGCGKQEVLLNVGNMKEDSGKWIATSSADDIQYYWVIRLSEDRFMEMWHSGLKVESLPQKHFDSSGEGFKMLEKLK